MADVSPAEDAVQDMFIHFWENRIKLQVKDSLRAYFYTCIRHRALKNLQKQAIVRKHNPKLTEFIEYLILNQGRPISQEEFLEHVWDSSIDDFSNSIRVHISSLRKKLRAALGYDPIHNRIGEGYVMENKK